MENTVILDETLKVLEAEIGCAGFPNLEVGAPFLLQKLVSASQKNHVNTFYRWALDESIHSTLDVGVQIRIDGELEPFHISALKRPGMIVLNFSKDEHVNQVAVDSRKTMYWNSLLKCFEDGIVFILPDGVVESMSSRAPYLLGLNSVDNVTYSSESMIGKNLLKTLRGEICEDLVDYLEGLKLNSALRFLKQYETNRNTFIELKLFPYFESGELINICALVFNITQRVRNERLYNNAKERALESAKLAALGEMTGGIAHEINTPLTTILLSAEMMKKSLLSDPVKNRTMIKNIERIEKTTTKVAKIVSVMRVLARDNAVAEEGSNFENINEILEDVYALCEKRIKDNEIIYEVKIQKELLEKKVAMKRTSLTQILTNLVNNGIDEMIPFKGKKNISVNVDAHDGNFLFHITDSGKTPPPQVVAKMFDPFFTTKPAGQGTGLGLSLSKSLAKSFGGDLVLDLTKEHTCFELSHPLKFEGDSSGSEGEK